MIRNEGRAEGLAIGKRESTCRLVKAVMDFLSDLGTIPEDISTRIDSETNSDTLTRWAKLAARSASIEEFIQKM